MNNRNFINEKSIKVILTLVAFSWGLGVSITRGIINAGVNATSFIFYRFLIGAVVLFLMYKKELIYSRANLAKGLIAGTLLFLFFVFQTIGLKYTSVSNTAIYTGASALITPILSWLILKKNINKKDILAAGILIFAIAILNKFNFTNANIGDMYVLISALFLSLQVIYISKVSNSENTISLTVIMLFTTALLGFISAVSTNTLTNLTTVYSVKEAFLYLGIFTTALAFFVQNNALRYTSESQISLILSTEAIWGVIFGVLIFNDVLNINIIIAVILMAYALYLSVK